MCGNSFRMLQATRFSPHFEFLGDFSRHYGLFPGCGSSLPFTGVATTREAAGVVDSGSCC
jgi:arsenite methyltransferase